MYAHGLWFTVHGSRYKILRRALKSLYSWLDAENLIKGCRVLWQRSCQRVADKMLSSQEKVREKGIFLKIRSQIQVLESTIEIGA